MESRKPKSRIRNLSTRYLPFYKTVVWILLTGILFTFVWGAYESILKKDYVGPLLISASWWYLLYRYYKANLKVFHVEFDHEFLYVIQKKQDILIPLENIKDVEIVSLGGVYKVTLYSKDQLGDLIYFKPSLLYPFNFKAKDKLVDVLRHTIDEAKKKVRFYQKNVLQS